MKKLSHDLTYPGATIGQVSAMLADPAFRADVCAAQRVVRQTIEITPAGEGMTVLMDQVQITAGVPGFARKIVGEETAIRTEEVWSSPTSAALHIVIPGKPGDMRGDIVLVESGDGVVERVRLDVVVSIPLVGGKIEGLLVDLMDKALSKENQAGRAWLARQS